MNRRRPDFKIALLSVLASAGFSFCALSDWGQVNAPQPAVATDLNAGPTYTGTDGKLDPKFPRVEVVFDLSSANGAPVPAKAADLKLFSAGKEIGVATSFRTFEQTGQGLTAILAIDASGSMKGAPLAAIHASIAKFVGQARDQDQVEVITFADDTKIDVPFGASKSALTQELQTVQARGKFTHLYDGLMDALDQFSKSQPKRRQILVISDGHDEGSKSTIPDVTLKANRLGVVIDSIGLTKDAGLYLHFLEDLSKPTGGKYRRAQTADDLEGMIGQGIDAKRATPVALFKTSNLAGDETLHAVQLHWLPGNLSAPAFVLTPKYSPFSNLWLWGLGGCFFAGLILLIVSWLVSRRNTRQGAIPAEAQGVGSSGLAQPGFAQPGGFVEQGAGGTFYTHPGGYLARRDTIPDAPFVAQRPFSSRQTPYEAASFGDGTSQRSDTLPDTIPLISIPRSPLEPPIDYGGSLASRSERAKTQLATFFEQSPLGAYARLDIQSGEQAGRSIFMMAVSFTMGAIEGNDAVLTGDSTTSGRHARLYWENSILKIEDLNSTNGTFLNSVRLSPGRHLLKPGDEILMGQTSVTVSRA